LTDTTNRLLKLTLKGRQSDKLGIPMPYNPSSGSSSFLTC
jgi:hypothetical protein